jgi:hypothetical protein
MTPAASGQSMTVNARIGTVTETADGHEAFDPT